MVDAAALALLLVFPGKKLRLKRPGEELEEVLAALFMWSWGRCIRPCNDDLPMGWS